MHKRIGTLLILAPVVFAQGVCPVQPATPQPALPAGCSAMVQVCTCTYGTCSWQWACTGNNPYSVNNATDPNGIFSSAAAQPQQQTLADAQESLARKRAIDAQTALIQAQTRALLASPEMQAYLQAQAKQRQAFYDREWAVIGELRRQHEYPRAIEEIKYALRLFPGHQLFKEELKTLRQEAKEYRRQSK